MDLVKDMKWNNVIIEGDALNVVKALQGKLLCGLHSQVVVDNTIPAPASIDKLCFEFCFREANCV